MRSKPLAYIHGAGIIGSPGSETTIIAEPPQDQPRIAPGGNLVPSSQSRISLPAHTVPRDVKATSVPAATSRLSRGMIVALRWGTCECSERPRLQAAPRSDALAAARSDSSPQNA